MKSEFRVQVLSVLAIVISITALTIGFAAFSSTLTIDGSATVVNTTWDVHFETLSSAILIGDASVVTAPTINGTNSTAISTFNVSLATPGDSATYTFYVANDGTYDAELSSITIPTPECSGTGEGTTDATNVCTHISYTLTYADDTVLEVGDTLAANATVQLKLTLSYNSFDDATLLPNDDVTISNLAIALGYKQI